MSATIAILLALAVILAASATALRSTVRDCPVAPDRPDLAGTTDEYLHAVLERGRRRREAEARARHLRMTALEVRRAGDVAAGPPVPDPGGAR